MRQRDRTGQFVVGDGGESSIYIRSNDRNGYFRTIVSLEKAEIGGISRRETWPWVVDLEFKRGTRGDSVCLISLGTPHRIYGWNSLICGRLCKLKSFGRG